MVTRRDVDKIKDAGNSAYRLAWRDLEKLWATLPFGQPEACREILLQAVPGLVEKYGQMAAVAALEWYEQLRAVAPGLPAYCATLPPATGLPGEVVRASLGGLWETDETRRQVERDKVFNALNANVEKGVKQQARDTVTYNARRDPAKPRYARVPSGEKTCAFCMMLASNGFTYKSGDGAGGGDKFHENCDCQIVPEFGKGSARIAGYDPDAMQEKYKEARKQAQAELQKSGLTRAPTPGEIAQQMRIMYADSLSDGKGVKRSNYVRKASQDGIKPRRKIKRPSGRKNIGNKKPIGSIKYAEGLKVDQHEVNAAKMLSRHGFDIEFLPVSREPNVKNPDIKFNGEIWEMKSPKGSSENNTISDQFKRARKQARNFILDLSRCGVDERIAVGQAIRRFKGQNRIQKMIIIKRDGSIERYEK